MTEQESIMIIQAIPEKIWEQMTPAENVAIEKAVKSMKKQIPKKVVNIDDFADYAECPSCGAIATDHLGCLYGWCRKCGQKLKRSE